MICRASVEELCLAIRNRFDSGEKCLVGEEITWYQGTGVRYLISQRSKARTIPPFSISYITV